MWSLGRETTFVGELKVSDDIVRHKGLKFSFAAGFTYIAPVYTATFSDNMNTT
jgi:hypothetical protein